MRKIEYKINHVADETEKVFDFQSVSMKIKIPASKSIMTGSAFS